MNNIKGQEEADRRFEIIAPLINISDPAERRSVREALAKEHGISTRTISRYEKAFEDYRYSGLLPKERKGRIVTDRPQNWDDVLKGRKDNKNQIIELVNNKKYK